MFIFGIAIERLNLPLLENDVNILIQNNFNAMRRRPYVLYDAPNVKKKNTVVLFYTPVDRLVNQAFVLWYSLYNSGPCAEYRTRPDVADLGPCLFYANCTQTKPNLLQYTNVQRCPIVPEKFEGQGGCFLTVSQVGSLSASWPE